VISIDIVVEPVDVPQSEALYGDIADLHIGLKLIEIAIGNSVERKP
jgi:hypothetical protein